MPGGGKPTYDVIIVLGARVLPGGRSSAALRRRVAHGVALYRQGRAKVLLLTGGVKHHPPPEAEVMRDQAIAAGVLEDCIVLEPTARSTFDNAAASAHVMERQGWSSALVVTDRLHLPRALLAFRAVGVAATGSGAKGGWREEPLLRWGHHLLHEGAAIVWYCAVLLVRRLRH